jgi:hypothetical protein
VTLKFDLTHDDVRALHRFLFRSPKAQRTRRRVHMLALMLGLFPLGVIATMLFSGHAKAESYLLLVPPAALYGLFWLLLMRVLIFPSEPRAIATDKLGSRTIALSERGVAYTWPGGEVLHFWKTIAELADDGMHLFLGLELFARL